MPLPQGQKLGGLALVSMSRIFASSLSSFFKDSKYRSLPAPPTIAAPAAFNIMLSTVVVPAVGDALKKRASVLIDDFWAGLVALWREDGWLWLSPAVSDDAGFENGSIGA
ncbi:hypothetical protein GYMLUDRAFT_238985 [Collybiopsis luxurians FD-317 M1]|nr:hypothetical protein GYMLUDRAFT_238985 [Collybiopsis luxurians FD-317 M1]